MAPVLNPHTWHMLDLNRHLAQADIREKEKAKESLDPSLKSGGEIGAREEHQQLKVLCSKAWGQEFKS